MTNRARHLLTILIVLLLVRPGLSHAGQPETAPLSLAEALNIARRDNTLLQETAAAMAAQEEALHSARAEQLPKLAASYTYARLQDAPYAIFGPSRVPVGDLDHIRWDVTVSQPLFTGFALTSKRELAALGVEIKDMEQRQATLEVARQVKTGYYRILLAEKQRTVADDEVAQLTAHAAEAKLFYEQGLIPYNDLLKSQVGLADARQTAKRAQSNLAMAKAAFNALLRLPVNQPLELEAVDAAVAARPALPELASLQAEAVEKRPERSALQLAISSADQAERLARSAYYPEIGLVGQYERTGEDWDANTNAYGNWQNTSIAVKAKWTLFEWGKTRAEVSRQAHEQQGLAARLARLEDTIRLEVQQAWLNLSVADENIRTAEESLAQARENFRITDLQYKESVATSTDVLDARTALTRSETNYHGALYGLLTAAADLERAVGRGDEPAAVIR